MTTNPRHSVDVAARRQSVVPAALALLLLAGAVGCRGRLDVSMDEFVQQINGLRKQTLTRASFVAAVGSEPHKTVRLGDGVYWYFYCRDGKVILKLDGTILAQQDLVEIKPEMRKLPRVRPEN
jgi:hypothetical protein